MKWIIPAVLLLAGCSQPPKLAQIQQPVKSDVPPMPAGIEFAAPTAPPITQIVPLLVRVTLEFEAEAVDTNYAKTLELGLTSNADLGTTNWQIVWTGPYPGSTNTYAATNFPGSWWTSNYLVTVRITLSNQPALANNYRAFWRSKP